MHNPQEATFSIFAKLFGISLDLPPDETEMWLMIPSVRRILESQVDNLRWVRSEITTLLQAPPTTISEANKALTRLRELRGSEQEQIRVLQTMLLALKELGFETTGWNTEAPPLDLNLGPKTNALVEAPLN